MDINFKNRGHVPLFWRLYCHLIRTLGPIRAFGSKYLNVKRPERGPYRQGDITQLQERET